jgi:uncharacterized protein YjbJ (UPF0337 family)
MTWEQFEVKWKRVKGDVKQRWGNLTDNDLMVIDGSRDKLIGRLQERYGLTKEQVQYQVNAWILTVSVETPDQYRTSEASDSDKNTVAARRAVASRGARQGERRELGVNRNDE